MSIMIKRKITSKPVVQTNAAPVPPREPGFIQDAPKLQSKHPGMKDNGKPNWDYYMDKVRESKNKEGEMKVKAKVAEVQKKTKEEKKAKVSITSVWESVLAGAVGKNQTDKAIADQMNEAATKAGLKHKKYTESDAATCRGLYNRGQLTTQNGKVPAAQLERFEAPVVKATKK